MALKKAKDEGKENKRRRLTADLPLAAAPPAPPYSLAPIQFVAAAPPYPY